jgi:hypothetical protein
MRPASVAAVVTKSRATRRAVPIRSELEEVAMLAIGSALMTGAASWKAMAAGATLATGPRASRLGSSTGGEATAGMAKQSNAKATAMKKIFFLTYTYLSPR